MLLHINQAVFVHVGQTANFCVWAAPNLVGSYHNQGPSATTINMTRGQLKWLSTENKR